MKKFFKIAIINIFLIFMLLIIAEIIAYMIEFNTLLKENVYQEKAFSKRIKIATKHYFHTLKTYNYEPYYEHTFRKPYKGNSTKNLILLGCSYTYGTGLEENQSFHYKLGEQTNINVFNLGIPSGGPREILHLLRNNDFTTKKLSLENNAEYVIYTYISDHLNRLTYDLNYYAPHFKQTKEGQLIQLNRKPYYCSFLYRQFKQLKAKVYSQNALEELFFTYMKEINSEIKQNFKTSKNTPPKLIILVYADSQEIQFDKVAKLEGVKVIEINKTFGFDFKDKKYHISETDKHPSENVWEVIVPALVKELNL